MGSLIAYGSRSLFLILLLGGLSGQTSKAKASGSTVLLHATSKI